MKGLEELKAGDPVALFVSGRGWFEAKVERTTPTQVVVNGVRFYKSTGFERGKHSWSIMYQQILPLDEVMKAEIEAAKAEREQEKRRYAALAYLNRVAWRHLPIETLEAVIKLVEEAKA